MKIRSDCRLRSAREETMASRWVLRCCSCQTPGQSNERPSRVFPARAREHGGSKRTNKLVRDKVIKRVYAGDNDDWLMGSGCHIRRGWEDEFVPSPQPSFSSCSLLSIISLSSSSPTRLPPSTLSLRLVNRGVHSFAKRHSFLAFFSRPCIPPRPHFSSILILWQTIYRRPPRLWPVVPRSLRMSLTPYMPIHRRRRPVN